MVEEKKKEDDEKDLAKDQAKQLAGYEFKVVPDDPRMFANFRTKEFGDKLYQW